MPYSVDEIVKAYEILVKGIEADATDDEERAFGGIIRAGKGKLVESMTKHLVEIAWNRIGGNPKRISFEKQTFKIPINKPYIKKIKYKEVRDYILSHITDYYYGLKTDVLISIDRNVAMAIECKAYTENAMLKRIMVDFTFLKTVVPDVDCVLCQLESQLTGDYSKPRNKTIFGSPSTHTIMSYFDVDLHIITLLEGERKVDEPIHNLKHYKDLDKGVLELAITPISEILKKRL